MSTERDYKSLLPKLLSALYPNPATKAEAEEKLNSFVHNEPERVKVGILKVSNGNLNEIDHATGRHGQ